MGMQVKVTTNPNAVLQFLAALRTAEVEAAKPVLADAAENAPYEEVPRHGVHLRDTGYVLPAPAQVSGADHVIVGFTAFWAPWQHEKMGWHHTHGHAKFLELAVVGLSEAWKRSIAARLSEAFRA